MQAIVLAGGRGERLAPLTDKRPKALVELGGIALIDLVIAHLSAHGVTSVLVAAGYRADQLIAHCSARDYPLAVEVIDCGLSANTGGRAKMAAAGLDDDTDTFLLAWCDGISDVDLSGLLATHQHGAKEVTLAAVHPPPRFGELNLIDNDVVSYHEKQINPQHWISGGYFAVNRSALGGINSSSDSWEHDVLTPLTEAGGLGAYRHEGAWQCIDNLSDLRQLEALHAAGAAYWTQP